MNQFQVTRFRVSNIHLLSIAVILVMTAASALSGQTEDSRGKNNPFSPSPPRRVKQAVAVPTEKESGPREVSLSRRSGPDSPPQQEDRPTIAQTTFKIAKHANFAALPPTEIYKIGVGDVLYISLKNASQGSGYYTVRADGTIDYPLAGENVIVADQTVDNVQEILASSIRTFRDAVVEVRVREYASHKITVSGMADHLGQKASNARRCRYLQSVPRRA